MFSGDACARQLKGQIFLLPNHAQQAVSVSLASFDEAMNHLARAVDEVSHVIQEIVGLIRLPKEEFEILANKTRDILRDMQKNPQPYALMTVAAITVMALRQWRKNKASE